MCLSVGSQQHGAQQATGCSDCRAKHLQHSLMRAEQIECGYAYACHIADMRMRSSKVCNVGNLSVT